MFANLLEFLYKYEKNHMVFDKGMCDFTNKATALSFNSFVSEYIITFLKIFKTSQENLVFCYLTKLGFK